LSTEKTPPLSSSHTAAAFRNPSRKTFARSEKIYFINSLMSLAARFYARKTCFYFSAQMG
jgi:hypothetical protein